MSSRIIVDWIGFCFKGWFKPLLLFIVLISSGVVARGQTYTSISSIPVADGNGEIHVCLGSVVLFSHETPASLLVGSTDFNCDFGNGQSATTAGPHPVQYSELGSFEVSLSIVAYDGDLDLGEQTFTVIVEDAPPMIPTLAPGNACTIADTIPAEVKGGIDQVILQTQNDTVRCTCCIDDAGPAVSMMDTRSVP